MTVYCVYDIYVYIGGWNLYAFSFLPILFSISVTYDAILMTNAWQR